ncbi:MAG TPA: hypothetical protein VEQ42_04215, partial [Pyrinomonadaceae bacterium]|nr:hypothetical protein [Pyrinomonadaceae bacterium]
MAEERSVGLARAPETRTTDDAELTKEELQRRMEQARESITQTVAEIKETVSNQYNQVRESISESLDWREQFRRRPVPFVVGAVGVGLLVGYSVGGVFGGSDDYDEDYEEDEDLRASMAASHATGGISPARSYAGGPITGGSRASDMAASGARTTAAMPPQYASAHDVGPETRAQFANVSTALVPVEQPGPAASAASDEPEKPGIFTRLKDSGVIDKVKESKAYERLQDELAGLGDRFVEELSQTARNVVVPALLGKLKDLVGIDLGTQREVAQRSRLEHETTHARGATEAAAQGAAAQGASAAASGTAAGGGYSA